MNEIDQHEYLNYINGEFTHGSNKEKVPVENPANEKIVSFAPKGSAEDARSALEAASGAKVSWAKLPAIDRSKLVFKLAKEIRGEREKLAKIIVLEQGKPLDQAEGEVDATANFLEYAAEQARRIEGEIFPSDNQSEDIWIRRAPYGVVVALTAWNYPMALVGRKLGPALVAGNTVVLKGHEITPLSGLEIARLADRVGFPRGVINVISGTGREVGDALVKSPLSNMLTMTGSVRAGREIFAAGAKDLKVLRLELGGNAPFIVMEDADIDRAVNAAIASRFTNCGQICTCAERIFVNNKIAAEFTDRFVKAANELRLDDPMLRPDMGPKVSSLELEKVEALVESSVAQGAELLAGGNRSKKFDKGHWFEPTVLLTNGQCDALAKEIFGPVAPIALFEDLEEVLDKANDTEFGLSAYLFTQHMGATMRAIETLEFGEIYVNRGCGELVQGFHNGWKHSGLGGEDGHHGFEGYLRKKTVYLDWSSQ
jgi:lactaldehyde dehydrogenase/glycolaldehyde dehydrogenase